MAQIINKNLAVIGLASVLLSACASTSIPTRIQQAPEGQPTVTEVQQDPVRFNDATVRWGGTIVKVDNLAETTYIEVLARTLSSKGKPDADSSGKGRFMIRFDGFFDPEEYAKDRLLTVTGKTAGIREKPVGEYLYRYPLVIPDSHYLWPVEQPYNYYPFYRDPFYDPWYPFGYRYPYYW